MGLWLSSLFDSLFETGPCGTDRRILMLGLDGAGKTTVLYKLKLNENVETCPTIGFNVETVTPRKGVTFTVWDVGGQDKIRPLWKHYFRDAQGLLFVVDSLDVSRFPEARQELISLLCDRELGGIPVVILANKQDLQGAVGAAEMADKLGLRQLKNEWHVEGTCGVSGKGLYEAVFKLTDMLKSRSE
ncbi:ADP-ribosylation factor 1-like 2 [Corticium candelabrum]|uniref:ADP-ribosylation factor 1-like 2 n=1 Tax=Corticium candelabrum TaxID=121492 RepID=UPI002E274327|nr:ADP-ribosylation factor 1-like 2 [Corticium candelabrum]